MNPAANTSINDLFRQLGISTSIVKLKDDLENHISNTRLAAAVRVLRIKKRQWIFTGAAASEYGTMVPSLPDEINEEVNLVGATRVVVEFVGGISVEYTLGSLRNESWLDNGPARISDIAGAVVLQILAEKGRYTCYDTGEETGRERRHEREEEELEEIFS